MQYCLVELGHVLADYLLTLPVLGHFVIVVAAVVVELGPALVLENFEFVEPVDFDLVAASVIVEFGNPVEFGSQ